MTSGGDFTSSNGMGIEVPSLLPSALGQVAAGIATGIADAGTPDPIQVRRRWAVVTAINADSTVDINLGGEIVPHVSYDASYHPALDETVQVNVVDTDITVIGPTANATYVGYIRRTGTITSINTSGTAPGYPTSVSVTLSDAQDPVTILNVPFVSEYFPSIGDTVMLGQGTNTNVYLVLGAVNRGFRRPTGDIEPTVLSTAKPNTLLCNGQLVSRTTYAALWAWVQLNGLVTGGVFSAGDGSTTFGMPDFRGRVPIGAGTGAGATYTVGQLSGSISTTLSTAQMPAHDHNVAIAAHGTHDHSVTATVASSSHSHSIDLTQSTTGTHTHLTMGGTVAEGPNPPGTGTPGPAATASSSHGHSVTVDAVAVSAGSHTVTESSVGGTTPVDVRQPSIAINWLVWF